MSVPNALTKIIDKHGVVVDFDLSRIIISISAAIADVYSGSESAKWTAQRRAEKYAQLVAARVYREYYDLRWLKCDFLSKFLSFKPEEREQRMKGAFVTQRLACVLRAIFHDRTSNKPPADRRAALESFIRAELVSTEVDPRFSEGLFPIHDAEREAQVSAFLTERVFDLERGEVTPESLYPTREYIQDTVEKELKAVGEVDTAEGYMIYREGRKKLHANEISESQFTNNGIHWEAVRQVLSWNIDHECDSVFTLNEWVNGRGGKDIRELIALGEKRFKDQVDEAARKIVERSDELKVVIIAGPSCSNKTTTTVIIGQALAKAGHKLRQLNVDDYFFDLTEQPKDEFGDYDFEMPEAIDMELLNSNLADLLDGRPTQKPVYSFKKGCRDGYREFRVADDEIILIDCLHGLYRKLTESVPQNKKFRIYIESMNVIRNINGTYTRWADIRMLKRMIRDVQHRGYGTDQTLAHWPYVRKGELKHIIPYIYSTDAVINSGLPYELAVLKKVVGPHFPDRKFIDKLRQDGRRDAYIRGTRTAVLLETVSSLDDLALIPETSPIREFIGGSSYIIPHNE